MRAAWVILAAGSALATAAFCGPVFDQRDAFRRPLTTPFPASAPYDPQIATLGKMLFFDPRLSGAQNMSCSTCHNPSFGWEAPVARAIGAANKPLGRHTPTILDVAWVGPFFWDGRAADLEAQAKGPITSPNEMNATMAEVVTRLSAVPEYAAAFREHFPDEGMTEATILRSIATFERTVVSGWSPFDRWIEGDETAISDQAKHGFDLFTGVAGCSNCHVGWNFTDNQFHDIGLLDDDHGRAVQAPDDALADHAFKTPGLRNIALRAPYTHSGAFKDLQDVIRHYADNGVTRPSLSPLMNDVRIEPEEVDDLIAFLETLTEETTDVSTPILPAN